MPQFKMTKNKVIAAGALFFAFIFIGVNSFAAKFDNLVEKGEFYNEKGASYASDAVKVLEKAIVADPARAEAEPRFVGALAEAYVRVYRYSEAYYWLARLEVADKTDAKAASIMDFLLNETGSGRLRIASSVVIRGFTGTVETTKETRLVVSARKALDKLKRYLARPHKIEGDGLTLLVPEGSYTFGFSSPVDLNEKYEAQVEVWAGDEIVQNLIGDFPPVEEWEVESGNRLISLKWPTHDEVSTFKLLRSFAGEPFELLYKGEKSEFADTDAPIDEPVTYRLLLFNAEGDPLAQSSIEAWAMSPVSEVTIEAFIGGDLKVNVSWAMDYGTVDWMYLKKIINGKEEVLYDLSGEDVVRAGELLDGPIIPSADDQPITYIVETWVNGASEASSRAETTVVVPPLVARIEAVEEYISPDRITVEWGTYPNDGLAEGFAIYVTGMRGVIGELVGKVPDGDAREFSYVPRDSLPEDAQLRHFVIPYLGDKYLYLPYEVTAVSDLPKDDMKKRSRRGMENIPDLALSWDPVAGVKRYVVTRGERELIIKNPYIELKGLQTKLKGGDHLIKVEALMADGSKIELLKMDLGYMHYPRN